MTLQQLPDGGELFVNLRQLLSELADRIRRARARDNIFALGVQQIFAVQLFLTRGWITRESDPRSTVRPHVAEDHGLYVHGRAQVIRNPIDATIIKCATAHP